MKKSLLLCAIIGAIGTGQLYGMEPILPTKEETEKLKLWQFIHRLKFPDLQRGIVNKALAVSKNLDEAVDMIKKFSILHRIDFNKLFNLKNFTQLAHILADNFGITTADVASKFNTSVAQEYQRRGKNLLYLAKNSFAYDQMVKHISQGADVNFLIGDKTPLNEAIQNSNLKGVQTLLDLGAKPRDRDVQIAKDTAISHPKEETTMIKQLIEEAMQKKQSVLIDPNQLYDTLIKTKEEKKAQEKAQRAKAMAVYTSPGMLSDVKQEIINHALAVSDTLEQTIDMLKKFSILHGLEFEKLFNNLKDFTRLMHMLANKFTADYLRDLRDRHGWSPNKTISSLFDTLIGKRYFALGDELGQMAGNQYLKSLHTKMIELINQGADVNYFFGFYMSPLRAAIGHNNLQGVKILLNAGAKINLEDLQLIQEKAIKYPDSNRTIMIKQLIEEAWEKQQQK